MTKRETMVKIVSSDIDVETIDFIEADFDELRVNMKSGKTVVFSLSEV